MSIKRTMLLAGVALAAIALAIPAAASASGTWTHNNDKLAEDANLTPTGNLGFEVPGVLSYKCDVHVEATLTAFHDEETVKTGEGHVTKVEITTATCAGTGALAGCTLAGDQVIGLPWKVTATKADIDITSETKIDYQFDEECVISEATTAFPSITLSPDTTTKFSHLNISGTAPGGGKATGTLQLPAGQAKTYGVHQPA